MMAAAKSRIAAEKTATRRHQLLGRVGHLRRGRRRRRCRGPSVGAHAAAALRGRPGVSPALGNQAGARRGADRRRRAVRRHGDCVRPRRRPRRRLARRHVQLRAEARAIGELVRAPAARSISDRKGFVEFGCQQIAGAHSGPPRRLLIRRTGSHLRATTGRASELRSEAANASLARLRAPPRSTLRDPGSAFVSRR